MRDLPLFSFKIDEVEVAYGLLPEFWNMGLATEFVEAVVRIEFSEIGLSRLACIIHQGKPHLLFRRDIGKSH